MTRLHIPNSITIPKELVQLTNEHENNLIKSNKELIVPKNSLAIIGAYSVILSLPNLTTINLVKTKEIVEFIESNITHDIEETQKLILID